MTKKEIKKMQEEHYRQVSLRKKFVNALNDFWADVDATTRFYRINNDIEKLKNGYLDKDEQKRLFERYDVLKLTFDFDDNDGWKVARIFNDSKKYHEDGDIKFEKPVTSDTLIIDDLWNEQFDKVLKLSKAFGFTHVLYLDNSTACMENLAKFVENNCKIVGTNAKLRKNLFDDNYKVDRQGLVIEL